MVLPVSLAVFDQLLNAGLELIGFIEDLTPTKFIRGWPCTGRCKRGRAGLSISGLLQLLREAWDQICGYGRWQAVQIEKGAVRVEVRFY